MQKLQLLLPILFFISCSHKDNSVTPSSDKITEEQIIEEIKNQPTIKAEFVAQLPVKKIEVSGMIGGIPNAYGANYDFDYFTNGKLKVVKANAKDFIVVDYNNDKLNITTNEALAKYDLGSDNLVKNTTDGSQKYYYKDGYLVRILKKENTLKNIFSVDGNLKTYEDNNTIATFEYFDFPNNIRQEVLRSEAIHWTFRDDYLGKFSANLLKKATFKSLLGDASTTTLEFSYQFDQEKRVNKMTVSRMNDKSDLFTANFDYSLSY